MIKKSRPGGRLNAKSVVEIEKAESNLEISHNAGSILFEISRDAREDVGKIGASRCQNADDRHGDQRCDEAVFDGRSSGFILEEADKRRHLETPCVRNYLALAPPDAKSRLHTNRYMQK